MMQPHSERNQSPNRDQMKNTLMPLIDTTTTLTPRRRHRALLRPCPLLLIAPDGAAAVECTAVRGFVGSVYTRTAL